MSEIDLEGLKAEYGSPKKAVGRSAREERIIAGIEDIQRFVDLHGRLPEHGEDQDIFERVYATRLDRLRDLEEAKPFLGSLGVELKSVVREASRAYDSDPPGDLASELKGFLDTSDITQLKYVRSTVEKQAAEEVASRTPCTDFGSFKPLFSEIEADLQSGLKSGSPVSGNIAVELGEFYILEGQMVYVAEIGDGFVDAHGQSDARLRLIYSNGTESNLLRRSFQRAFYRDELARRISSNVLGGLFGDISEETDIESGTIYVLRSLAEHPFVAANRELVHKVGVTGGSVEARIANASLDPTFLLAEVEVIAVYKLAGINRTKLEKLVHRIFAEAQIDLVINDRFGNPVKPKEWFLVPLHVIDEAVSRIVDGSIMGMKYSPSKASLVQSENG